MKRSVSSTAVLAWVLAAISILVAAPALAQEEEAAAAPPEAPGSGGAIAVPYGEAPPPAPPYFVYNGGGTVTIDGDVGTSCFDFALTEEVLTRPGDLEQLAQSVVRQCEQDGFLTPDNRYAAFPPAQGQQPPVTQAALPATGGPGLSSPGAPFASGALLIVLAVLGIALRRRTP